MSEASFIIGIMSLKDNDDLLLVPQQIWAVIVGNLRHCYLRYCRVLIICELPLRSIRVLVAFAWYVIPIIWITVTKNIHEYKSTKLISIKSVFLTHAIHYSGPHKTSCFLLHLQNCSNVSMNYLDLVKLYNVTCNVFTFWCTPQSSFLKFQIVGAGNVCSTRKYCPLSKIR